MRTGMAPQAQSRQPSMHQMISAKRAQGGPRPSEWVESPSGSLYEDSPFTQALDAEQNAQSQEQAASHQQPDQLSTHGPYETGAQQSRDEHTRDDVAQNSRGSYVSSMQAQPAFEFSPGHSTQDQPSDNGTQQYPYRMQSETTGWIEAAASDPEDAPGNSSAEPMHDIRSSQGSASFTFAFAPTGAGPEGQAPQDQSQPQAAAQDRGQEPAGAATPSMSFAVPAGPALERVCPLMYE